MSQPLLFVSPADGQVHKVTASELVTLEEIDNQIAHHQGRIDELNVEKAKYNDLTSPADPTPPTPPADPTPPVDPATPPVDPNPGQPTPPISA